MTENQTRLPLFELIPYATMLSRLPQLTHLQKGDIRDGQAAFYGPGELVVYFAGDVSLNKKQIAQLQQQAPQARLWAVNGDLRLAAPCIYNVYVSGNLHCELFVNTEEQRVGGTIFARLYAALLADPRERLYAAYPCKLDTPYLFVWHIDISAFTIAPQTVIFIMCSPEDYKKLSFSNPHFYGEEGMQVLKPEMRYHIAPYDGNTPYWNWSAIKLALEQGKPLFTDGFDLASWRRPENK